MIIEILFLWCVASLVFGGLYSFTRTRNKIRERRQYRAFVAMDRRRGRNERA